MEKINLNAKISYIFVYNIQAYIIIISNRNSIHITHTYYVNINNINNINNIKILL